MESLLVVSALAGLFVIADLVLNQRRLRRHLRGYYVPESDGLSHATRSAR